MQKESCSSCSVTLHRMGPNIVDGLFMQWATCILSCYSEMTRIWSNKQATMMIFYSSMTYDYLEEYVPFTWKDVLGKKHIQSAHHMQPS